MHVHVNKSFLLPERQHEVNDGKGPTKRAMKDAILGFRVEGLGFFRFRCCWCC